MKITRLILPGFILITTVVACAAKWKEPPSWTLRQDGRLRAEQRHENFSFDEWKAAYLDKEKKAYGYVVTPAGAESIARELARRDARIVELENQLKECR